MSWVVVLPPLTGGGVLKSPRARAQSPGPVPVLKVPGGVGHKGQCSTASTITTGRCTVYPTLVVKDLTVVMGWSILYLYVMVGSLQGGRGH